MSAHWSVLAAALLAALVSVTVAVTLAIFAGQAVPQAARRTLAAAPDTSVLVSGPLAGNSAASETVAVRAAMRSAFGSVPFAFYAAQWTEPLPLASAGVTAGAGAGAAKTPAPTVQAVAADGIQANSVLTSGSWPATSLSAIPQAAKTPTAVTPAPAAQPVTAALDAAAAGRLHVPAGGLLTLRTAGSSRPILVRVTGLFRPRDPASAYWRLDPISQSGVGNSGGRTIYGPLVVSAAALHGPLTAGAASWVAVPAMADIPDDDLLALAGQLAQQQQYMLYSATLGNLTMATGLPAVLDAAGSNLVVARSLLVIAGLQLLFLVATALGLTARLLASQRQAESAQLAARGATRWQLVRLSVAEAVLVAAVAAVGGLLAGGSFAGVLARAGPLRAAGLHTSLATAAVWWTAASVSAACAAIVLLAGAMPGPAARGGTPRRGRLGAASWTAQAGADVALVLLAAVTVWELRRYSAVTPSPVGTLSVDPVLALAPALALAAGTAVLLRLVPLAARACDRLAVRGRRLAVPLASWQLGRRPVHQAGSVLLVVMAVATGTFVLSVHESWLRSARDQSAFTVGADVRVDTRQPTSPGQADAIATAPGVRAAMAVARLGYGSVGQGIALDTATAARVVLLRPDLSTLSEAALFGRIRPAGEPPGLDLPGRLARLRVNASLGPATLGLAPADVTVSVQDADGTVYALPAGRLPADGRVHPLDTTVAPLADAVYPLRLLAVTLNYPLPRAPARQNAVLSVYGITTSAAGSGPFAAPFAAGSALRGWQHAVTSAALSGLLATPGATSGQAKAPRAASWRTEATAQALSFSPGADGRPRSASAVPGQVTLTAVAARAFIPGIATQAYLTAADATVGTTVQVTAAGFAVPVKIVAAVAAFPSVSGPGGAVIVDLAALQDALSANAMPPAPVSEWWLTTAPAPAGQPGQLPVGAPPGLRGLIPAGATVTVAGQLAAGLLADPLSAAPQQALLGVAAAAGILAVAGLAVAIAAKVAERAAQRALLSALGVPQGLQAWAFCLEQLMLSVPSAAAGLALGATLAWLVVPAVTLTAGAVAPVPPALTEYPWFLAVSLAAAVAVVPVLAAAVTMAREPDPAAQLRTLETP